MTNQEAITKLTNIMHDDHYAWHPSILTTFGMAVDALKGADGDCISRQFMYSLGATCLARPNDKGELVAITGIRYLPSVSLPQRHENDCISRAELLKQSDYLEDEHTRHVVKGLATMLPSAQPEQLWIPCSERMPEEYGEYICTLENGQVQECGFVPENQMGLVDGWSTCEADGHKFLGYADVLAWMPLPEPARLDGE